MVLDVCTNSMLVGQCTPLSKLNNRFKQRIINYIGKETFGKKPKLAILLRELKSTPVKKFFSYVCNPQLVAFWVFAAIQQVNGCFPQT